MKAVQIGSPASHPTLSIAEVPTPRPGDGQVLVQVHAAGVIPTELSWYPTTHQQAGQSRLNAVPGHEFCGRIAGLGQSVPSFRLGDTVYGMNDWFWEGATAEYCLALPSAIAAKPMSLSPIEAATVPISALTAWQGLHERAQLQPGDRVLVQGGGGAVGLFVVQLAHLHGAHVMATCSAETMELVKELGADQVIDYKASSFEDGLGPVDVVFDTVGGSIRERSMAVLKPGGRLVSIAADAEVTTDPKVRAAYFIVEPNHDQLAEVGRMLDGGRLRTFVKAVVPLEEAGLAYTGTVPAKAPLGKVVVQVTEP